MKQNLDHPTIQRVKDGLSELSLRATEFRGDTTIVANPKEVHALLRFLRDDPDCNYDLLCDVTAVDYLHYPAASIGRFAVVWLLVNTETAVRIQVKTYMNPSIDTSGIENHPDLRRILMWKDYPAHPLRKDYPLQGRNERVNLAVVSREDA